MKRTITGIAIASLFATTGCVKVDEDSDTTSTAGEQHTSSDEAYEPKTKSQTAYEKANVKMHEGMAAVHPDADTAFMQGMVPHHQGAIDMAEIVLEYGKDPEARALAETIIASQTKEITQMNAWLEKRGVEPAKPSAVDHEAMGH